VFVRLAAGQINRREAMPLRIRVIGQPRAGDLLAYLRSMGADARQEGNVVTVSRRHPVVEGEPPFQDRMELEFVLRAWANQWPGARFEVEEAA
jgi:hypothetical protein